MRVPRSGAIFRSLRFMYIGIVISLSRKLPQKTVNSRDIYNGQSTGLVTDEDTFIDRRCFDALHVTASGSNQTAINAFNE